MDKQENREYLEERYKEVSEYMYKVISSIDKIRIKELKKACIFTVIDCLAQEYGNYNTKCSENNFIKFVLLFSAKNTKYKFLNKYDIISLYYNDKIKLGNIDYRLNFLNIPPLFRHLFHKYKKTA